MDFLKKIAKRILQYQARLVLRKYNPKIIAVVGAVGKTLTRETIYSVLSKKIYIRKSEKSFTTEVGVPLTILGCPYGIVDFFDLIKNIYLGFVLIWTKQKYPEWILLELDSDKPKDLESVSEWIKPDLLVITAIGEVPSHIETFGDIESFLREKSFMVDAVKRNGVIIYNSDDYLVQKLVENTEVRKVSCGIFSPANISGSDYLLQYGGKGGTTPVGMSFSVVYRKKEYSVSKLEQIGIHIEYASLLAFAVGHEFHISSKDIVSAIQKTKVMNGRSRVVSGIKNSIIIDDTYNASPVAVREFIKIAGKVNASGRKVLILGDMLELGRYSAVEHRKLAEEVKVNADYVITIGFRMRKLAEELLGLSFSEQNIVSFDSVEQASVLIDNLIQEGDLVLVKGSQDMRLEKIVEEIMRHPEDARKILARQEKEWLDR